MAKRWGPGNPLWEWQRKHGKLKTTRRRRARGGNMARKRYGRHRRSGGLGGRLMRGFVPVPGGMMGKVIAGGIIGYAHQKGMIPKYIPYQDYVAGGVVGGLPAVAGVFGGRLIAGGIGSTVSTGAPAGIKVLG